MLDKQLLALVLDEALQKGGDFAEIYVEERKVNNILCEDDRIEKINHGQEKGAGIRVIKNGNTAYVYTNDLSREGLCHAAAVANHAAIQEERCLGPVALKAKPPRMEVNFKRMPAEVSWEEKIEQVLAANKYARNITEEIRQVTVMVSDIHRQVQIANSRGELTEEEKVRVRFAVNVTAANDGVIQTGFESMGGTGGWELIDEVSLEDIAGKAARLAVNMLSAQPAPVGKMPVVMAGQAGGTMVHEACGHGLEADLVQKGLSVYRDRKGEVVAMPEVSVIDDGTIAGKYGTAVFDDEGCYTQKNILIKNGELLGYMYDRLTAEKEGRESSGNGRRESYQHKPIPRMTNTYIAAGSDDPEEIIKTTSKGLLVKKMGGGQVNTINGDFVFEVQEGYWLEDGEIKHAVRGATLIGNGPEVLLNIERLGNDLGFSLGTCGKDGQGVAVSDAQPTIRIKQLTVGGTIGDESRHIARIRRK